MNRFVTIENFLCLIVFLLPLYMLRVNVSVLHSSILELLAAAGIVFLIAKSRSVLMEKMRSMPKLVLVSAGIIIAGVLLSALFNNAYLVGLSALKGWFLVPIFFSFALYVTLDSEAAVEKVFFSLYLSAAAVALVSLAYKASGIVTYDGRLASFYLSPNYLAMYLSPGLFFGSYFLLKHFFQHHLSRVFFLHLVLTALIALSLYYTYSYGAWVAAFLSMSVTLALIAPEKKYAFAGGLFLLIAAIFLLQMNAPKFTSLVQLSQRSSLASRMMIWKSSLLMIEKNPVLGIGPGNFQATYLTFQQYFPPYLEWAVPQPHNIFLAFWLQSGIFGLAGFLLLLIYVLRSLAKIVLANGSMALLAASLFGFFLYTAIHGIVDTPYWKNDLAFLFWIGISAAAAVKNLSDKKTNQAI